MELISSSCPMRFKQIITAALFQRRTYVQHLTEAIEVRDLPGMADVDSSLLWFCREIKQDFCCEAYRRMCG